MDIYRFIYKGLSIKFSNSCIYLTSLPQFLSYIGYFGDSDKRYQIKLAKMTFQLQNGNVFLIRYLNTIFGLL
jgi:hypothetical protein